MLTPASVNSLPASLLLLHSHWALFSWPGAGLPVIDCIHAHYLHIPSSSLSSAPGSDTALILHLEVPVTLYMASCFTFLTARGIMIAADHLSILLPRAQGPSLPNSRCTLERAHAAAFPVWLLDGGVSGFSKHSGPQVGFLPPTNTLPFHLPNAASHLSKTQIWACPFFSLKAFLWLATACRMNSKFCSMLTSLFVSTSGISLAFQLHPGFIPAASDICFFLAPPCRCTTFL